jgi:hypothetical protein
MRKRAKENDQTFDQSEECIEWQSKGVDLEAVFWRLFSSKKETHGVADHGCGSPVEPHSVVPKTVPNAVV